MAQRGTLAFRDVEQLEAWVDDYFIGLHYEVVIERTLPDGTKETAREARMKPPTMAGLALHLDLSRNTLINYGKATGDRSEYVTVIGRAKDRIAEWVETALYDRDKSNGARFALDVNHGYGRRDEDQGEAAGGFIQQILPPAIADGRGKAVAKWGDDDGA